MHTLELKGIISKPNSIFSTIWFKIIIFILVVLLTIFLQFKIEISDFLTFEQTIFVMVTGVMIVFREFIFSYSAISKIRQNIKMIEKNKDNILTAIGGINNSANFSDYINTLNIDIEVFVLSTTKLKKTSTITFLIFIFSGLLATIFKLNDICELCVLFLIYFQIVLIPSWAFGGFCEELRKTKINLFFEDDNIVADFNRHCDSYKKKQVKLELKKV